MSLKMHCGIPNDYIMWTANTLLQIALDLLLCWDLWDWGRAREINVCVFGNHFLGNALFINTLRTGDADLRFYITPVQDEWRKSAFLTRACFLCTVHLIMQYIEPVSEWFCWRMFIETWPHSELMFCDKYSEQRAFYFPLLLCSAFSQCSDFNHDGKR